MYICKNVLTIPEPSTTEHIISKLTLFVNLLNLESSDQSKNSMINIYLCLSLPIKESPYSSVVLFGSKVSLEYDLFVLNKLKYYWVALQPYTLGTSSPPYCKILTIVSANPL